MKTVVVGARLPTRLLLVHGYQVDPVFSATVSTGCDRGDRPAVPVPYTFMQTRATVKVARFGRIAF